MCAIGKITLKSKVLNSKKSKDTPNAIPISPILFIIIAFNADLFASRIVNQKLINKYETNPTPSQPTKSCKKLSAVTNISMNQVKSER